MNVAMLISGGVDSSVALRLLKDQGHEVTAFYLKIWLEDELSYLGECPWEEDLRYAEAVCEQAGVPLKVVSLQREYWDRVVSYTIAEAKAGRTPNPDIFCNLRVKFGAFYEFMEEGKLEGVYDKIATGHYAQVSSRQSVVGGQLSCILKIAPDAVKDQTYFLSQLTQEQLSRAMFPIGHLRKVEVRELAERYQLPNRDRKDSQGICFLGKVPFREFLKHHLGEKPGDLVEQATGKVIGRHLGYWFYTIGQRQGLGLSGGPWFVVGKEVSTNVVYLAHGYEPEEVYRDSFDVGEVHWINPEVKFPIHSNSFQFPNKSEIQNSNEEQSINMGRSEVGQPPTADRRPPLFVKIRHGAGMHECWVEGLEEARDLLQKQKQPQKPSFRVHLKERVHGVAPGQFAVFYAPAEALGLGEGMVCLGGGMIVE